MTDFGERECSEDIATRHNGQRARSGSGTMGAGTSVHCGGATRLPKAMSASEADATSRRGGRMAIRRRVMRVQRSPTLRRRARTTSCGEVCPLAGLRPVHEAASSSARSRCWDCGVPFCQGHGCPCARILMERHCFAREWRNRSIAPPPKFPELTDDFARAVEADAARGERACCHPPHEQTIADRGFDGGGWCRVPRGARRGSALP